MCVIKFCIFQVNGAKISEIEIQITAYHYHPLRYANKKLTNLKFIAYISILTNFLQIALFPFKRLICGKTPCIFLTLSFRMCGKFLFNCQLKKEVVTLYKLEFLDLVCLLLWQCRQRYDTFNVISFIDFKLHLVSENEPNWMI